MFDIGPTGTLFLDTPAIVGIPIDPKIPANTNVAVTKAEHCDECRIAVREAATSEAAGKRPRSPVHSTPLRLPRKIPSSLLGCEGLGTRRNMIPGIRTARPGHVQKGRKRRFAISIVAGPAPRGDAAGLSETHRECKDARDGVLLARPRAEPTRHRKPNVRKGCDPVAAAQSARLRIDRFDLER